MKLVDVGRTGLRIHPLVFGTLPLGPLQARLTIPEGGRLIRHALESGVNLLDTAALYETYPYIREGIAGFGGCVRIATKTHALDAATARSHVEGALRDLGVPRLDIVHLHGARLSDPLRDRASVVEELLRMKEEGKIALVGLSSHYISAIRSGGASPHIDVLHPLINRQGLGILDGSAAEMAQAIEEAAEAGKGVYAMKALAGGNLISEARRSLQFTLGVKGVHAVAVGMLSREEIDANLDLFSGEEGESERWRKLEGRRRHLKIMTRFCKGCKGCISACPSGALYLEEGHARVRNEDCILCGYCAAACPEFIIRVV